MNVILRFALLVLCAGLSSPPATVAGGPNPPEGWAMLAPRDEIRPAFSYDPQGGPKQTGSFVISHDQREGLDGWFQKSFTVTGGEFYRFSALRKTHDVAVPRHSGLARIVGRMKPARSFVPSHLPARRIPSTGFLRRSRNILWMVR